MGSLVLGTVQLGIPYGIANTTGQPDLHTAIEIVRAAWEGGIREFDTAQGYGTSEEILGQAFAELGIAGQARVVSKLAKDIDPNDVEQVVDAVKGSLKRLGISKLFGLLLHKEELLDKGEIESWGRGLCAMKDQDLVRQLGASVYSPQRALQIMEINEFHVVQVPANILDRRFEEAGVFQRAKESDKIVYVRSAFLQGLLLTEPETVPPHMEFVRPVVKHVGMLSQELGLSRIELALGYLKTAFPFARVVVGAETPAQVREIIIAWNYQSPPLIVDRVRATFFNIDQRILDPRLWPKNL